MAKARREEPAGGTNLRFDDFIRRVKPEPDSTEKIVLLHGYVGESTSDDKIRLYSDASLCEYADIARADILYSLPDDQNPLGGSTLWIRQTANVQYADASAYAQGDMYNDYLSSAYMPTDQATLATIPSVGIVCPVGLTRYPLCRPSRFICPTPVTKYIICDIRRTRPLFCPVTGPACPRPSWVDACPSQWGCTPMTVVVNPVYGGQMYSEYAAADPYAATAGDYTGGEMYNEYMSSAYTPEALDPAAVMQPGTPAAVPLQPALWRTQPWFTPCRVTLPWYPPCRITQPWYPPCRITQPWYPPCRPTAPQYPPCRTRPWFTPCRISQLIICTRPPQCPIPTFPPGCPTGFVCGVNNPGAGGFTPGATGFEAGNDPYGYGGY